MTILAFAGRRGLSGVQAAALASYAARGPMWLAWDAPEGAHIGALESGLLRIYAVLHQAAVAAGCPLWDTAVLVEEHCGHDPALDPEVTAVIATHETLSRAEDACRRRTADGQPEVPLIRADTTVGIDAAQVNEVSKVSSQLEDPASPAPSPITTPDGSSYTAAAQAAVGTRATVCLGGTFDHLHAGHKVLLTVAGLWAHTRVYCGVTTPVLLAKKAHADVMQSYDERAMAVTRFLSIVRRSVEVDIVAIDDGFGPTVTLPDLEALTVSEETRAGADAIGAERARRGYKPLAIHAVSLVVPEGRAAVNKLSSTLIRSYIAGGMKDVSLFGLSDPEL